MADLDLQGRVALLTGASRGLGRAIAQRLAASGATLALAARSPAGLEETARLCREAGVPAAEFQLDVTDSGSVNETVEAVRARFGAIDILINNAGTAGPAPAPQVSDEEWDRVLRTNLTGPFYLCRALGPLMREQGGGKIVNVASVAGLVAAPYLVSYAASKGGLVQLTRTLAVEWARYNIQVNAVAPAYVRTDMNAEDLDNPDVLSVILRATPAGRLGMAEEVAEAVHYLVGANSDYITGQILAIDGGWTAQ